MGLGSKMKKEDKINLIKDSSIKLIKAFLDSQNGSFKEPKDNADYLLKKNNFLVTLKKSNVWEKCYCSYQLSQTPMEEFISKIVFKMIFDFMAMINKI